MSEIQQTSKDMCNTFSMSQGSGLGLERKQIVLKDCLLQHQCTLQHELSADRPTESVGFVAVCRH